MEMAHESFMKKWSRNYQHSETRMTERKKTRTFADCVSFIINKRSFESCMCLDREIIS